MKLSDWAKNKGISYQTAWRLYRDGALPVKAMQLATGTIIVEENPVNANARGVALYARVSGSGQQPELTTQLNRLVSYATNNHYAIIQAISEVGSGLNGHRPKLMKLLADPNVKIIIAEHKDRLVRFGYEYIEASLKAQGRRIIVVEQGETKDDLVQDMIDVLTSFCARLYGRRSAKNKAKKALEAIAKG